LVARAAGDAPRDVAFCNETSSFASGPVALFQPSMSIRGRRGCTAKHSRDQNQDQQQRRGIRQFHADLSFCGGDHPPRLPSASRTSTTMLWPWMEPSSRSRSLRACIQGAHRPSLPSYVVCGMSFTLLGLCYACSPTISRTKLTRALGRRQFKLVFASRRLQETTLRRCLRRVKQHCCYWYDPRRRGDSAWEGCGSCRIKLADRLKVRYREIQTTATGRQLSSKDRFERRC